jgi:hypothetical protein
MAEPTIAAWVAITLVSLAETMGSAKNKVQKTAAPMAREMSQCMPVKTGAIFDEDSSKLSSNMDYRLLKNYARSGPAAVSGLNRHALKLP